MSYKPDIIESKWQQYWADNGLFSSSSSKGQSPKFYVLDMFPYPSGKGLHVGHVEGYTASDIVARYKRMKGYDVLHPMGWDAFGLPAEQYAIESGIHPAVSTKTNISNFRVQCKALGLSYDWSREFSTTDPQYYKWTQWIFLKLFEHGLAYRADSLVNWCPALGTVLANDEVIDGRSERGSHPVIQRPMTQWMLKISAYADRLLEGLDVIDYPESIKSMQRDRIGRSEGIDISFPVRGRSRELVVFTTRPETLFGATYCVVAPEHPLLDEIATAKFKSAVDDYRREASKKAELARLGPGAGKTGVFTGAYALNPVTGQAIPIWTSDYVLMTYGTGATMCVPGHDKRDWEFARKFNLRILEVVSGGNIEQGAWVDEGLMLNSKFLDGMSCQNARKRMTDWLTSRGIGHPTVRYRMHDWIFARQRYWGEPIPIVFSQEGNTYPLPYKELPLLLPHLEDFQPDQTGNAPLGKLHEWCKTTVPGTEEPAWRETHTMPALAASSWYFLRFVDPHNQERLCDPEIALRWMPVDLYIGGAEHAVGHLMYARFITKFLYDLDLCPVDEPFRKLVNQGMILGQDNRKMSKRYGNVINPMDVIREYGADTLRLYEMSLGPIESTKPWNTAAILGSRRFLDRVWRLFFDEDDRVLDSIDDTTPDEETLGQLHRTIAKVDEDTENLRFNTAISQMMILVNFLTGCEARPRAVLEKFLHLLSPYAPHIAEEIWSRLGHKSSLGTEPYPIAEERYCVKEALTIAVQVNGRVRGEIAVPRSHSRSKEKVLQLARSDENVRKYLSKRVIVKSVYVPGRIISIATK